MPDRENKVPLREPPVYTMDGPVPQLRVGDLIGRRDELRAGLKTLRDSSGRHAGVVLTGIGGAGKSALAGRMIARLKEDGWLVVAHCGRFDLAAIAVALGAALLQSNREPAAKRGEQLVRPDLDERVRQVFLGQVLAEERILLVLDDFEQNLGTGGDGFRDEDTATALRFLAERSRTGRMLITSRYPVPDSTPTSAAFPSVRSAPPRPASWCCGWMAFPRPMPATWRPSCA
jgi:AAA ATPase domain